MLFAPTHQMDDKNTKPSAKINMKARQAPLMEAYRHDPDQARIVDSASTTSEKVPTRDAIHSEVLIGTKKRVSQAIGVHKAVGGECDMPNPGEILSAALAACLDVTIRIIANRVGLSLRHLAVHVDAHVDTRGTLRVSKAAPVGFQTIDVRIEIEPSSMIGNALIGVVIREAEKSCVVLQTLKNTPEINITRQR